MHWCKVVKPWQPVLTLDVSQLASAVPQTSSACANTQTLKTMCGCGRYMTQPVSYTHLTLPTICSV
eukprot:10447997-Alexandrium_andersonii.AAC.1